MGLTLGCRNMQMEGSKDKSWRHIFLLITFKSIDSSQTITHHLKTRRWHGVESCRLQHASADHVKKTYQEMYALITFLNNISAAKGRRDISSSTTQTRPHLPKTTR